jgi:hypothetical protein
VRTFKGKWFNHFAAKASISDDVLRQAAAEIEQGVVKANLGGDVYKKRIARPGQGKSGGFRTIVFFRSGERLIYWYGYPKNERDNISDSEEKSYKLLAKKYFSYSEEQIEAAIKAGEIIEL